MNDKTILITGATRSMGKAALLALAKLGHTIIFVGRNEAEAKKVKSAIVTESGNSNIDYLLADLMCIEDIYKLAAAYKAKYNHLDVLVQNAGGLFGKEREESKDGIEKTIALNLAAPYLLNILLLDVLQKRNGARIVMTASAGHSMMAKPDFNDIELKQGYSPNRAYGNAKLFLIMMARVLHQKLKEKGWNITVNTLHPGIVINDKMEKDAKEKGFLGKNILLPLMKLLMKTPEQGAATSIYLATSPEVEGRSGLYFSNCKPAKVNEKYITEETKKIIWDYCGKITGTSFQ
ncbi:MAG: SDR family NAD(P)-dependent oxidoreductase [Agriterribacter sp.]